MMNAPLMPSGISAMDRKQRPAAIPPMPDYHARVMGYMAGGAIIMTGVLIERFPAHLIWAVPWPCSGPISCISSGTAAPGALPSFASAYSFWTA